MHTAHGSRPNVDVMNLGSHGHLSVRIPRVEHHTFCMRTAQNYAISENDTLETTILTSTNTTGTLARDDLDQPGTTYSTYPVVCGWGAGVTACRCIGLRPLPGSTDIVPQWLRPESATIVVAEQVCPKKLRWLNAARNDLTPEEAAQSQRFLQAAQELNTSEQAQQSAGPGVYVDRMARRHSISQSELTDQNDSERQCVISFNHVVVTD